MMAKFTGVILVLITLITTTILSSNAQSTPTCNHYSFQSNLNPQIKSRTYQSCVDLPVLNSFLHYNYHPSSATLEIAYRHPNTGPASSRWVAWALNPTAKGMVGAQSLVAYHNPKDGSLLAYTSPITSYDTKLAKGGLSFNVTELKAESGKNEIIIFATINLPNNMTLLNQVWQEGPLSNDGTPRIHSLSGPNTRSVAPLNLLPGTGVVAPAPAPATATGGAAGGVNTWKNVTFCIVLLFLVEVLFYV